MSDDKAAPADLTRCDHEALVAYARASDLRNDPLVIDLCNALAAERDRADQAEASLADIRRRFDDLNKFHAKDLPFMREQADAEAVKNFVAAVPERIVTVAGRGGLREFAATWKPEATVTTPPREWLDERKEVDG